MDIRMAFDVKNTKYLGHDAEAPPVITIDDYELDVV